MPKIIVTEQPRDYSQFMAAAQGVDARLDPALIERTFSAVSARPSGMINIDVSTLCNLKCHMCPIWGDIKAGVVKRQTMDYGLFETVMEHVQRDASPMCVGIVARGELFCHPRAMDICRDIRRRGFFLSIVTNGTLMKPRDIDELTSMQGMSIRISVDALLPETYEKIRTKKLLGAVARNVTRISSRIRGQYLFGTKLGLHFVLQDLNEPEMFPFLHHWGPFVDLIRVNKWNTTEDSPLSKLAINSRFPTPERHPCTAPWLYVFVDSDGSVYPCCSDSFLTMNMGNLREQSLRDIWLGEPYQKLRAAMLAGDLSEHPTCAKCNNWIIASRAKPVTIRNHVFTMREDINCFEFTYNGGLLDLEFDAAKYESDARALMEIFAPPPE
jgi:radical SAM protein with 4Fe4S-binding SPASM domain